MGQRPGSALCFLVLQLSLVLLSSGTKLLQRTSTTATTTTTTSTTSATTPTAAATAEPVYSDTWFITTITYNGDCAVDRPTTVVNGQMPGPLVQVDEGTRVIITVVNQQPIPVTIHWHGIKQRDSQWHDGVGSVTQCPIPQNSSFTYNFSTEGHSGTLWWHAHVAAIRNTVFGGLYVNPRPGSLTTVPGRAPLPVPVEGEMPIFLMDWYESSSSDLVAGVIDYPYQGWPPPDALLINNATRLSCLTMVEFTVKPLKWYRLRVVNTALYATLNFIVQKHLIYTYEAEGGYLKNEKFKSYDIMSGQSYSFLLFTDQKPDAYWLASRARWDVEGSVATPGLAIMRYEGIDRKVIPHGRGVYDGPTSSRNPYFTWGQVLKTKGATAPPDWIHNVDKFIMLELNMNNVKNGKGEVVTRYSWNNVSLALPSTFSPLLAEYKGRDDLLRPGTIPDLPPRGLTQETNQGPSKSGFGVVDLPYGKVIQIVFQGHIPPGLNHPIHLHGTNFYVVGRGYGRFSPDHWGKYDYNLENPVERNTAWLLEGQWTAVRFKADNPGVWLMHCHLEPHVEGGMMVVFRTHKAGGIPEPPQDYPNCTGHSVPS